MTYNIDDVDNSETPGRTADTDERPITVRHDWEQSREPSVSIVEAVAAATGRPVTNLPPLQKHIDPDALNALLSHGPTSLVDITFTYADATVSVNKNGVIEIRLTSSDD